MRHVWIGSFVVLALAGLTWSASQDPGQGDPAREAYHEIEANVFKAPELQRAAEKIELAYRANPNDPWVYLAASLATLVSGYTIGDWYEEKTFIAGTVNEAKELALQALDLDRTESQAHAHLARLTIIQGDYPAALEMLDEAMRLDPGSFYPWYFRGIVAEKTKKPAPARADFGEAEERATFPYQTVMVNIHRQQVAALTKEVAEQERLLRENIRRQPEGAHLYGNYADFLMEHGRYGEAVEYWERAIELGPYPDAARKLEEARRLAAENGM